MELAFYEAADACFTIGQFFTPWRQSMHIDGRPTIGWDKSKAFSDVVTTVVPYSKAPAVSRFSVRLTAPQFSQFFNGTFVNGLRPSVRGFLNKQLNNQLDKPIRNAIKPTMAAGGFAIDDKD